MEAWIIKNHVKESDMKRMKREWIRRKIKEITKDQKATKSLIRTKNPGPKPEVVAAYMETHGFDQPWEIFQQAITNKCKLTAMHNLLHTLRETGTHHNVRDDYKHIYQRTYTKLEQELYDTVPQEKDKED